MIARQHGRDSSYSRNMHLHGLPEAVSWFSVPHTQQKKDPEVLHASRVNDVLRIIANMH